MMLGMKRPPGTAMPHERAITSRRASVARKKPRAEKAQLRPLHPFLRDEGAGERPGTGKDLPGIRGHNPGLGPRKEQQQQQYRHGFDRKRGSAQQGRTEPGDSQSNGPHPNPPVGVRLKICLAVSSW